MNQSKVKEQRREYIDFKEDFGSKIQAISCGRGSGLMATISRGSGLITRWWSWLQFPDKSAPIAGRSGHDREPRSCVRLNRCRPIFAARSWWLHFNRLRRPLDGDLTLRKAPRHPMASPIQWRLDDHNVSTRCSLIPKIVKDRDRPMKPRMMKIVWLWRVHASPGKLSIKSTYTLFWAHALMDDRVDAGPRDRWFVLGSDAYRGSTSLAQVRFRRMSLNTGAV